MRRVPDVEAAPSGESSSRSEGGTSDAVRALRQAAQSTNRVEAKARIATLTREAIEATGRGLNLAESDLSALDLSGFDLRRATLNRTRLHGTQLIRADLTEASMICPGMERTNLSGACLRGAYLHALSAQVCDFTGADLRDLVDATGALFHGCALARADFGNAVLTGSVFYQCALENVSLRGANLQGATFNESLLDDTDFEGAAVSQVTITKCHLVRTRLVRVSGRGLVIQRPTACDALDLSDAAVPALRCDGIRGQALKAERMHASECDFLSCQLGAVSFASAVMSNGRFHACSFESSSFVGASLEGASIVDCRWPGAALTGANAENLRVVESSMPGADLTRLRGRCASFRDCDLTAARLDDAYLYRASFTGDPPRAMSLRGATAENANLVQAYVAADLRESTLEGANLTYARVNQTSFEDANLKGVHLYGASMIKVAFQGADLRGIKAPFFADRCPGLAEALDSEARGFVDALHRLLADRARGST